MSPHSLEGEVAVIGAVMISADAGHAVRGIVRPEDCYREAHRVILDGLYQLLDADQPTDTITLGTRLQATGAFEAAGGWDYLSQLVDAVPSAANARHHAQLVRDKADLRRLIEAAEQTIADAHDSLTTAEVFRRAEVRMLAVTDRDQADDGFRPMAETVAEAMRLVQEASEATDGIVGIRTGVPRLDKLTAGLQRGALTILAARPAMGKSALAWQFAERGGMDGHVSLLASYEMTKGALGRRGLARLAHIDADRIRRADLTADEWQALDQAAHRMRDLPILISDRPPYHVEQLRAQVRRHIQRQPVSLVVVDYLQQMSGPESGTRNNEVEHISRGLKRIAKELDVHVLALAQLSRGVDTRQPPRPVLSDLRDSGAIEQDADNVLMLWRPEYYLHQDTPLETVAKWQGKAELIVAKQRDGRTGSIDMTWESHVLRFTEAERYGVRA